MPIKRRTGGSFVTVNNGTIRVRSGNSWVSPTSVKVRSGGSWVDSGYLAYPNIATSFTGSGGTGDSLPVTFSWTAPASGAPVTGYRLYAYSDQACTNQVSTQLVTSGTTTQFSYGSAETTYYVRLKTVGSVGESVGWATTSSGGTILKVVNGKKSVAASSTYGWTNNPATGSAYVGTPTAGTASSWSGQGYDNNYNPGLAFDNNSSTYWRSQWWELPNIAYEWISFSQAAPFVDIRLISVGFVPFGNGPGTFYLDRTYSSWDFLAYLGGPGAYAFGQGLINCDVTIPAGQTYYFRINSGDMGYNPGFSNYNVQMSEIRIYYQVWGVVATTPAVAATANTVTNV